jgi:hypothetical protein
VKPADGEEFWGFPYGHDGPTSQPFIAVTRDRLHVGSVNCEDVAEIEFCTGVTREVCHEDIARDAYNLGACIAALQTIWADTVSNPAEHAKATLSFISQDVECPFCEGSRKVVCGNCKGGGTSEHPCDVCGNSGDHACSECDGKGNV